VSAAGFVVPAVDAGRDLDVVERQVDVERCHQFSCDGEDAAFSQRS
jgi:hypothetical protein